MKNLFIGMALPLLYAICLSLSHCSNGSKDLSDSLFVKKKVQELSKGTSNTVVELSQARLDTIIKNESDFLLLDVPYKDSILNLNLKKLDIGNYTVSTSSSGFIKTTKGLHYSGIIKNDFGSVVTLSITDNSITGIISSHSLGMLTIAKIRDSEIDYLIYSAKSEAVPLRFDCFTQGDDKPIIQKLVKSKMIGTVNKCIQMDYEMAYSNYQYFNGDAQAVTNYITTMFAGVKSIYANEGINISIKSIYIWTTPDGYDANTGTALTQLGQKRMNDPNFSGTLTQLVRGRTGGALSGIAWVNGLCSKQYRFSVAEPMFLFQSYPAFSWSVEVLTHEVGHNLGSPHTHSCSWVGGAIDNCYTVEGSCVPPVTPIGSGTIMSYCHLTNVGINFANGFGKQPHDLIMSKIYGASCALCDATPPVIPPIQVPQTDIALGKQCVESSQLLVNTNPNMYDANKVTDGNDNTFSHSNPETMPYIYVDLGSSKTVSSIKVINRKGCPQCIGRLVKFAIYFSDQPITKYITDPSIIYEGNHIVLDGETISIPVNRSGRFISLVASNNPANYLSIATISAYGTDKPLVCKDTIYKVIKDSLVKICK